MKLLNLTSLFLFVFISCTSATITAFGIAPDNRALDFRTSRLFPVVFEHMRLNAFESTDEVKRISIVKRPTNGGIKEVIPNKYKDRFAKWKAELRSTTFGREQWDRYANDKNFIVTIVVTGDRGKGAGTNDFLWDESGNFVGATINLGNELDKGF